MTANNLEVLVGLMDELNRVRKLTDSVYGGSALRSALSAFQEPSYLSALETPYLKIQNQLKGLTSTFEIPLTLQDQIKAKTLENTSNFSILQDLLEHFSIKPPSYFESLKEQIEAINSFKPSTYISHLQIMSGVHMVPVNIHEQINALADLEPPDFLSEIYKKIKTLVMPPHISDIVNNFKHSTIFGNFFENLNIQHQDYIFDLCRSICQTQSFFDDSLSSLVDWSSQFDEDTELSLEELDLNNPNQYATFKDYLASLNTKTRLFVVRYILPVILLVIIPFMVNIASSVFYESKFHKSHLPPNAGKAEQYGIKRIKVTKSPHIPKNVRYTKVRGLRVRVKPSLKGRISQTLALGTLVQVEKKVGKWCYIHVISRKEGDTTEKNSDCKGWVYSKYLGSF